MPAPSAQNLLGPGMWGPSQTSIEFRDIGEHLSQKGAPGASHKVTSSSLSFRFFLRVRVCH